MARRNPRLHDCTAKLNSRAAPNSRKTQIRLSNGSGSKKQRQLLPWGVDRDGKHFHVVCEIRISCKDYPLTFDRYSTKKDVHDRNYNSLSSAPIASLGSIFVIRRVDRFVRKGSKVETKVFKVLRCPYTRKQLLPNQTNKSRSSFSNE